MNIGLQQWGRGREERGRNEAGSMVLELKNEKKTANRIAWNVNKYY
jgi:hypothetical protein